MAIHPTRRKEVAYLLSETPSLRTKFADVRWLEIVWAKARSQAEGETGLDIDTFSEACPWAISDVLSESWLPAT